MSPDCTCIGENDTVLDAAKRLAELDAGAVPICGEDDRLEGMLTDRDIVMKVLAHGMDPSSVRARGRRRDGHDRRRRPPSTRPCER
jgi:CBS domain-containing protein